jgi:hypothetical protein
MSTIDPAFSWPAILRQMIYIALKATLRWNLRSCLQLPGKQLLSFPAKDTDHRVKRIGDSIRAVLAGQELDQFVALRLTRKNQTSKN